MTEPVTWPFEFLGRCPICLDNAYLNDDCLLAHKEPDCLVKRVRETRSGEGTDHDN